MEAITSTGTTRGIVVLYWYCTDKAPAASGEYNIYIHKYILMIDTQKDTKFRELGWLAHAGAARSRIRSP